MLSESPPGVTRWGTSIQLTAKGVNAMEKVWNLGALSDAFVRDRIVNADDRVVAADVRNEFIFQAHIIDLLPL